MIESKEYFCSCKFKYDYGNKFCSVNKNLCDSLFKYDNNSRLKSKKIKNCAILIKTTKTNLYLQKKVLCRIISFQLNNRAQLLI